LRAERAHPHWLAQLYSGDAFVDLIFGSGNGVATVDDLWFEHSVAGTALDLPVHLCPPEEMIWSKAFIRERERCDAADVAHLERARSRQMDWARLLRRFGPLWRLLLAHLMLFTFIYPTEAEAIPADVLSELLARLPADSAHAAEVRAASDQPLFDTPPGLKPHGCSGYARPSGPRSRLDGLPARTLS
jgi:hypothetical protein